MTKKMNNWSTYWIIGFESHKNKQKISRIFVYFFVACMLFTDDDDDGQWPLWAARPKFYSSGYDSEEAHWCEKIYETECPYHSRLQKSFDPKQQSEIIYFTSSTAEKLIRMHTNICDLMLPLLRSWTARPLSSFDCVLASQVSHSIHWLV